MHDAKNCLTEWSENCVTNQRLTQTHTDTFVIAITSASTDLKKCCHF